MQLHVVAGKAHANLHRGDDPAMSERARTPAPADMALEFGRFCLLPRQRKFLADGVPIELGGRALDLLLVLIEAEGNLVTKCELFRRVWSGVVVEENNLHRQIAALRKALGRDRDIIQTISGRGYCFAAPVRASAAAPCSVSSLPWGAEPAGLSRQLVELSDRLAELEGQVGRMLVLLRVHDTASAACA
jgi:non-specific serine/threonine protein kinase